MAGGFMENFEIQEWKITVFEEHIKQPCPITLPLPPPSPLLILLLLVLVPSSQQPVHPPIIATQIHPPKLIKKRAKYKRTYISELRQIEEQWNCSYNDPSIKPKQLMYEQLHKQWHQSTGGNILKEIKQKPSKSHYLYLEPRHIYTYRSQLRFNRCNWNESLYKRKLSNTPYCRYITCYQQHKDESVQHVLLECPQFQTQRRELKTQLKQYKLKLTLQTILGDVYPNHKKKGENKYHEATSILKLTYAFIKYIHERKAIMINR